MKRFRCNPPLRLRALLPWLALLALMGAAPAQGDEANPVIIEVGATQERFETLLERFEIAVAGIMASQGAEVTRDVLEQLYAFLPQFAEQRSGEIALRNYAHSRGIVVSEEELADIIEDIRGTFPDDASFEAVLASSGFKSLEQLAAVLADEEYARRLIDLLESETVIDEAELESAYQEILPQLTRPEEVCARHILVSEEDDAVEALAALREGASFIELALAMSLDTQSGMRGGDLGCFAAGVMVAPLSEAAFAATIGEVTEPVESAFGFHLILVYDRNEASTLTLDEVREPLRNQLLQERVTLVLDEIVASAEVQLYPERLPSFAEAYGLPEQD